ncbi:complement factor H-related protein 2-like [Thunnus thynnus]|uniref:complement factor H-related protein 2-like n=1 Tax=Thunnus thynnus TaxID=8237 RepID=UPI003529238D
MDVSASQNELLGCETPPFLGNGDIKDTMKTHYSHTERVEYVCQKYYIMEGEPSRTCINGEWTGQMRCLKPCTVTADDIRHQNIAFKYRDANKMYSTHDDVIEFKCTKGQPVNNVGLRQKCNDGVLLLPSCQ